MHCMNTVYFTLLDATCIHHNYRYHNHRQPCLPSPSPWTHTIVLSSTTSTLLSCFFPSSPPPPLSSLSSNLWFLFLLRFAFLCKGVVFLLPRAGRRLCDLGHRWILHFPLARALTDMYKVWCKYATSTVNMLHPRTRYALSQTLKLVEGRPSADERGQNRRGIV